MKALLQKTLSMQVLPFQINILFFIIIHCLEKCFVDNFTLNVRYILFKYSTDSINYAFVVNNKVFDGS